MPGRAAGEGERKEGGKDGGKVGRKERKKEGLACSPQHCVREKKEFAKHRNLEVQDDVSALLHRDCV